MRMPLYPRVGLSGKASERDRKQREVEIKLISDGNKKIEA